MDAAGHPLKRWKVRRCLYCELDYQDDAYLLSGGKWYRVRRDFVNQVNAAVDAIHDYDGKLPEYDDVSEGTYVKRVATADMKRIAAMARISPMAAVPARSSSAIS